MTIRHTVYTAALCLAMAGAAQAESYTIDPKHTFPSFEVSHISFSIQRGRFNRSSGTIKLDENTLAGSIDVNIAADSIDTGLEELEAKLKGEEFFNTARYPSITFHSDKFLFAGKTPIAAEGTLTLLGVSKPVRLAIGHFRCGVHPISKRNVCGADARAVIKRSEFGMKAFLPAVGDEVKILIQVEAFKD